MDKFTKLTGVAAPLPIVNVDTDMIIPKDYLKTIKRTGLAAGLFAEMRYLDDGSPNPDFVLNKPAYKNVKILVAGDNFGCGSSREHAPLAIAEAGAKVVVAEFYARIFFRNCVNGGYLLPCECIDRLVNEIKTDDIVEVDIDNGKLTNKTTGKTYRLRPLGDAKPIIDAGGVFEYAKQAGMLKV